MSSVYVLEPPTKGKVLFNTTRGPLDIELWPKEAPKAVRNFVQLCLDGYYNATIFHRIVKTFMIQGGDPTGTGTGGDTIYGGPFPDEFHSRLRFNHRGLVACANAGSPNSNNSQFFITLDRCDWLDKKSTIFGKITGETVYNLIKLGELQTDKDERPIDPPKILSVEVLWNPFDDVFPKNISKQPEVPATLVLDPQQLKAAKPKKKLNLLSFGEEVEEEEQALTSVKDKIKSSHDVLNDPRLLRAASDPAELDPLEVRRRKDIQTSVRQALVVGKNSESDEPKQNLTGSSDEDEEDFDARMRKQVMDKKLRLTHSKPAGVKDAIPVARAYWDCLGSKTLFLTLGAECLQATHMEGVKELEACIGWMDAGKQGKPSAKVIPPSRTAADDESDEEREGRKEKLSLRKKGLGSEARAALASNVDADVQLMTPHQQQLQKYKQRKRSLQGREAATLAKLEQFKKKVGQAKLENNAKVDKQDDSSWMTHELKFEVDLTKRDDMAKNDDPNQYVVHDPLLEKGKEKFNREQAKLKRRGREWAGKSLT